MSDIIENKVAKSGIVQIDLLDFKPRDLYEIDIAEQLWQGLVLKEKDFRDWVKSFDWSSLKGKQVYIHCSADAIVAPWAYMLVSSTLSDLQIKHLVGNAEKALEHFWMENIQEHIASTDYSGARIMIKGCGDESTPHPIFAGFTSLVQEEARSVMYGEPCSSVPIFKRKT